MLTPWISFEEKARGFANCIDERNEQRRGLKDDSRVLSL